MSIFIFVAIEPLDYHNRTMAGVVAFAAFFVAFGAALVLIPKLRAAGIVGKDVHKPGQPEIPEMGGFALLGGFTAGVLLTMCGKTVSLQKLAGEVVGGPGGCTLKKVWLL